MSTIVFTSKLSPSYKAELERLLFFNQNQQKAQEDVPLLVERYGMAHVEVLPDRLRVVLDASPEPQTLYAIEQSDDAERLVGVMAYLREGHTLSLVIAAVHEEYAGHHADRQEPLVTQMVAVLRDVARRVKGITSVTVFPGTPREKNLSVP
jgi:hypothetical protein